MKKVKLFCKTTLVLVTMLLGASNVWGNELSVTSSFNANQKTSTLGGNHCSFTIESNNNLSVSGNNLSIPGKSTLSLKWDNISQGYDISVSAVSVTVTKNFNIGDRTFKIYTKDNSKSDSHKFSGNDQGAGSQYELKLTGLDFGATNSGDILMYGDDVTWYMTQIKITYTITPDAPTCSSASETIEVTVSLDDKQVLDLSTIFAKPTAITDPSHIALAYNKDGGEIDGNNFYSQAAGVYRVSAYVAADDNCHDKSANSTVCEITVHGKSTPTFTQHVTNTHVNTVYNLDEVVTTDNNVTFFSLSLVADPQIAKVVEGKLYLYKEGTITIHASQEGNDDWYAKSQDFNITIAATTAQWTPETPAAGEFYLLNSKYNNQDNFLKATSVITTNPAEATKFTFTSATSSTISYVEEGTKKYVAQSRGSQTWGTNPATWTISASTSDDMGLGQGAGWKFVNRSGDTSNRHISINSTGGVNYIKDSWNSNFYVWNYISAAQMDAYLAYTQLSEYVSSKTVSVALKDKAVETLSANGFDSKAAYATKASNLKAVIDAYDAYAEVKEFLESQPKSDEKTAALAALNVATTTEAIYAAKRMIVFPLTLVAQNTQGYWATFSSDYDVEFSVGVTVYTVTVNGEAMELHPVEDRQVPANTGVLIKSANTEISYVSVAPVAALEDNMLQPGTGGMTTGENCRFYRLAYYDYEAKTGLGFYYGSGCEDGEAFMCKAGMAYLAVPRTPAAPARFLLDRQDISTDLLNVNVNDNQGKKVMMNGVLYIIRDGKTYDSFGRMVK